MIDWQPAVDLLSLLGVALTALTIFLCGYWVRGKTDQACYRAKPKMIGNRYHRER